MFLDEAKITVRGGSGGRGCVSWRREKYEPMGGPDGGNGGRGGDVVLIADENTDTLSDFASRKKFEAEKGRFGSGKNQSGKGGEDRILRVPPGTIVTEFPENGSPFLLADLAENGDQMTVASGGRGGYGNAHFKSATRQRPDFAELGEPGEERVIKLELKLVADIGIIGYPNVGKSTLISVISSAKPKIADYPFTTLVPNLGVVRVADRSFVICDVPGLIEGASEGKGLGGTFLKHIERCGALLHLLDVSTGDAEALAKEYRAIRTELEAYSPALAEKKEFVILNKIDLLANDATHIEEELRALGIEIFLSISAVTRFNTDELAKKLLPIALRERSERQAWVHKETAPEMLPVLKPQESSHRMGAFRIEESAAKDAIIIHGKRLEQFAAMTDFQNEGAVRRFRDVIERIGLVKAIRRVRTSETQPVYIAKIRVDEHL